MRSVGRAGRDRSRRLRTGFEPVPRRSERAPGETALLAEYPAGRSRHLRSNLCPDRGLAKKIALLEGRSRTDLHPSISLFSRFPSISTSLSASSYPCFFESSFDPSLLPRNFSASSYPCFFESSFDPSLLPRNFSMPLLVIWKGQRERGEATMMDSGYGNYVGEVKAS